MLAAPLIDHLQAKQQKTPLARLTDSILRLNQHGTDSAKRNWHGKEASGEKWDALQKNLIENWRQYLRRGTIVVNKPATPALNQFLSILHGSTWPHLLLLTLLCFVLMAIPFAVLLLLSSCGNAPGDAHDSVRMLAISFAGLCGMDIGDNLSSATGCITEVALLNFCGLLLQELQYVDK